MDTQEDDPTSEAVEIEDIATAEERWFEGWRPKYQPPDAPPSPTDVDHAWVYEEGVEDGFEDYVTVWRRDLFACTLDVKKRECALAFREHINAERKQRGERALSTRRMREWLQEARCELAEANEPPYRSLPELIKEHATKGVEADHFRLRNVMSGALISPTDLIPVAEGFVGLQPEAIEAYVDKILGGGHEPLLGGPSSGTRLRR